MYDSDVIPQASEAIRNAGALLIGAGAGMGVDSGLPDFRGNAGFWKAYPPFEKLGLSFVQMANPRWFESDPCLAWGFYGHRSKLYRETVPHAGFQWLLEWAQQMPQGYFVFTSNIDGHFQKAGFAPDRIVECHGSLQFLQCGRNCGKALWAADSLVIDVDPETFRAAEPLPRCPACGSIARPNVLMFGDFGFDNIRQQEQLTLYRDWLNSVDSDGVVAIELGAGTAIPTVRYAGEHLSALLIRINPCEPQGADDSLIQIQLGALEALTAIRAELSGRT